MQPALALTITPGDPAVRAVTLRSRSCSASSGSRMD